MEKNFLKAFFFSFLLLTSLPSFADAEDAITDAFVYIWHDQRLMLTSPLRVNPVDFVVWGTAAGSLIALAPRWGSRRSADERFEQGIERDDPPISNFLKDVTHIGDAPVLIGASLTGYGLGRWQDWPRVRKGSLHVFEGLIDAGVAAQIIKMLTGRRRPVDQPSRGSFLGPKGYFSDSENDSFVSGHATLTFVTATIVSHESRSYWVGIPAYLIAGGVSYSRIYVEKHWLSDTIAGAALGYSVGILVEHNRHSNPQLASNFYPYVDNDSVGIAWSKKF